MSQIKTINLTGVETKVEFNKPFAYVECSNLSDNDVLMSKKSNFARGDDDVTIIKAGNTATIGDIGTPSIKTVYLNGSGEVQLVGKNYAQSSFKRGGKGGDGNGGSSTDGTILLNMPFTNDLSDISGFDRTATYEITAGDTLTFTEDGVFLYKSRININTDFLVAVPRFTIDFDIKINSEWINGSYRRIALLQGLINSSDYTAGFVLDSANNLSFDWFDNTTILSSVAPTLNQYNDNTSHHITMCCDIGARCVYATTDNTDPIAARFNVLGCDNIYLGHLSNGSLNGYIKNFIIRAEG